MKRTRAYAIVFFTFSVLYSLFPTVAFTISGQDNSIVGLTVMGCFAPFLLGIWSYKLLKDTEEEDPLATESWRKPT